MFRTLIATALIAVAPQATPYDAAVATALYDLCPKVIAGTLKLDSPADLAAIGYVKSAPRGKAVWARRGEGQALILLSQVAREDGGPGAQSCGVMFTDDAAHTRFTAMEAEARKQRFQGPPAGPIEGAPKARMLVVERDGIGLGMIGATNHIELGNTPSTIAMMYRKKK